jgi:hypothetical protein
MPDAVTLPIARPAAFRDADANTWSALVINQLRAREADHWQRRSAAKTRVLGRTKVLAQNPLSSPTSKELRFQLNPRIAAKNKWARIEALQRNRGFLESYRAAWRAHLAGILNVLFPFDSSWMAKFGKVACEPPADALYDAFTSACPEPAPA